MIAGGVAVLVVAAAVVGVYAWNDGATDPAPANPGAQVGEDLHFYFGIALCDASYTLLPPTSAGRGLFSADRSGIIHAQPTDESNAGANATINRSLAAFSLELTADEILFNGTNPFEGGICPNASEPAELTWSLNRAAVDGDPGSYVPADGDVVLVSYNPPGTSPVIPEDIDEVLAAPPPHVDAEVGRMQAVCFTEPPPAPLQPKVYSAPPELTIDPATTYTATIATSCGDVVVELDAENAPNTVNNFVFLARDGYYDGTLFHRIVDDFVVQGGDREGTGAGQLGYTIEDENTDAGFEIGTLAMANAGPDTSGSQFFIVSSQSGADQLDGIPNYSIFGTVTEGLDVVELLDSFSVPESGSDGFPLDAIYVRSVTITES
jgi:cyclophilin family peptidyl-prolyl cis-trans isomerase